MILLLLMLILLLLMQILDSDSDIPYFDAYFTDSAASHADVTAYDGEFAVFVLHVLL